MLIGLTQRLFLSLSFSFSFSYTNLITQSPHLKNKIMAETLDAYDGALHVGACAVLSPWTICPKWCSETGKRMLILASRMVPTPSLHTISPAHAVTMQVGWMQSGGSGGRAIFRCDDAVTMQVGEMIVMSRGFVGLQGVVTFLV